jgi:O-antigen/teichoic acid export membrane protein
MGRAKHFLKGLGTSYLVLIANTLWTLVSLPVALHYLEQAEYTIWLIVAQVSTYFAMIDLGTSGSGIRLLVDHKDAPEKGDYGSLIKSMWLLSIGQSALILVVGLSCTSLLMSVLKNIPPELAGEFRRLWMWQVVVLAMHFALRIGNQILHAHQRVDISNYAQIGSFLVNLAVLLAGLQAGLGLDSFILAQGLSVLVMFGVTFVACVRLQLLPMRDAWGSFSCVRLKKVFALGSEFFLIIVGTTLTTGSQIFLLTSLLDRNAALEAALAWSVMTKLYTLGTQIVWRIVGVATPAFSEMIVRGEMDRLWKRYRSVLEISILASAYLGLLLALGNSAFVDIWTRKPISWPAINNWLLAGWFVMQTQACCHSSLILYLKQVGRMKLVYLFEGFLFVVLASLVIPRGSITGMLFCSILTSMLLTVPYLTCRVAHSLGQPVWAVIVEWFRPLLRFFAVMLPLGLFLAWVTQDSAWLRMLGCVIPVATIGAFIAIRFCLPYDLLTELLTHVPKALRKFCEVIIRKQSRPPEVTP